jgi:hypothetical protein
MSASPLRQEAPISAFLGAMIDDMSIETLARQSLALSLVAVRSVVKRTIHETEFKSCRIDYDASRRLNQSSLFRCQRFKQSAQPQTGRHNPPPRKLAGRFQVIGAERNGL